MVVDTVVLTENRQKAMLFHLSGATREYATRLRLLGELFRTPSEEIDP